MRTKTLIMSFSILTIIISFLIGLWAKRKVKSEEDFFGGTKLFGPISVALSSVATVASAFALVGVPGLIYSTGNTMAFWMLSSGAFALAYIILGKKVSALSELGKVASLGDLSDLRFNNNKVIKALLSIILFIGCTAYLASQIKAGSELFGRLFGWNPLIAGFVLFGVVIIYTIISGEVGGLLTQAFQGLVMIFAGIVMIIIFFSVTKGFGPVLEVVSTAEKVSGGGVTKVFNRGMLTTWGILPGSMAMAFMLIPIIGTVGQPQALIRMYALKDPKEMPKLGIYAGLAHAVVGIFAILMGYGALYLVGKGLIPPLANGDQAIFAFADYAGVYAQMLVYAAILSAALSSTSMFLSVTAGIVSRDLPDAFGFEISKNKQIFVSRIAVLVLGVLSILFSVTSGQMVAILGTFGWGTLMSATFPVFVIGLLWKKASSQGVITGLSASLFLNVLSLILDLRGFSWPNALPYYVFVVSVSIALTVFISLITDGSSGKNLDAKVEAAMDL